jgi:hypothetical protein
MNNISRISSGCPDDPRAPGLGHVRAVVVEPREGYPTKVDREYVVIQSEFYVKPDPAKKMGKSRLYVLGTSVARLGDDAGRRLAGKGLALTPLRVIDAGGVLKEPGR